MALSVPFYSIIKPETPGDFDQEWKECLSMIGYIVHNQAEHRIFKLNIFIHADSNAEYKSYAERISRDMSGTFGTKCAPFGISAHRPEGLFTIIIEVGMMNAGNGNFSYKSLYGFRYVLIESDNIKELWLAGIGSPGNSGTIDSSARGAYETLRAILDAEHMTLDNIVRQWNYIGEILQKQTVGESWIQNYQVFNEVRFEQHSMHKLSPGYPAATGVGMKFQGTLIDAFAVKAEDEVQIVSIGNPKQQHPSQYTDDVLSGAPVEGALHKHPPEFERAKMLFDSQTAHLYISGTAAIVGQKTVAAQDVELQTRVTLENIEILGGQSNLLIYCPGLTIFPENYLHARVFVKFHEDIPRVKAICAAHFGDVPVSYIQADICREDLLVEIEAEKSSFNLRSWRKE